MTPQEAAEYLGVHVGTLANWRCMKRGPVYHRVRFGRAQFISYRKSDLRRFKSLRRLTMRQ